MRTEAWAHQPKAIEFAEEKFKESPGVLLDMGFGTGKTRIALELVERAGNSWVLVLCTKATVEHWLDQILLHNDNESVDACVLSGGSVKTKAVAVSSFVTRTQETGKPGVIIVNYESAWRPPLGKFLARIPFSLIILDECQRLKNYRSAVNKWMYDLTRANPKVKRLGLSGQPLPNSPLDAYGLYRILNPSIFGRSWISFRNEYSEFIPIDKYQKITGYKNNEQFAEKYNQIRFHVDRSVIKLPDLVEQERHFYLPVKARKMYDSLKRDLVYEIESGPDYLSAVVATNVLAKMIRLQQITSGFANVTHVRESEEFGLSMNDKIEAVHSEKLNLLKQVIEEVGNEEPIVIFCRFIPDMDLIYKSLTEEGLQVLQLRGSKHELKKWQQSEVGENTVLIVQVRSGSEGTQLTRAKVGVFYSISFSLNEYKQALGRIHRPPQTENVRYVHLIARDTIDDYIRESLERKEDVLEKMTRRPAKELLQLF